MDRFTLVLVKSDDPIDFDPDAVASPAESGPEGPLLRQELRT
jgi:hypothetical protein